MLVPPWRGRCNLRRPATQQIATKQCNLRIFWNKFCTRAVASRTFSAEDPRSLFRRLEMQSAVKHNFHADCEADLNKLINTKLAASYTYTALGMYFDRDDVALHNFSKFFLEHSGKERDQVEKLLEYQNMRGGRILLQDIAKPSKEDWKNGLDALSFSLAYQKSLNTSILDVHRRAGGHKDPHLCDFLEQHFLPASHDTIKMLGDHISSLSRLVTSDPQGGMAEYLFDKHTL